jgi:predicted amidohydrolase YtcJ
VIHAEGRSLLPGFIDSHFHLMWGSLEPGRPLICLRPP